MNIAQVLADLLNITGVSRSKLAREIGVHTSTVSNWMDGKEPKLEHAIKLSEYFGCPIEHLTGSIETEAKKTSSELTPEVVMKEAEKRKGGLLTATERAELLLRLDDLEASLKRIEQNYK